MTSLQKEVHVILQFGKCYAILCRSSHEQRTEVSASRTLARLLRMMTNPLPRELFCYSFQQDSTHVRTTLQSKILCISLSDDTRLARTLRFDEHQYGHLNRTRFFAHARSGVGKSRGKRRRCNLLL